MRLCDPIQDDEWVMNLTCHDVRINLLRFIRRSAVDPTAERVFSYPFESAGEAAEI